jgi:hypothetical protein
LDFLCFFKKIFEEKHALREEKMFFFLANLDGSNKVLKFLGQPRPQTRK